MGLIKELFFSDNYHRIESVEYNRTKERLIVRTQVYKDYETYTKGSADLKVIAQEFTINEKTFVSVLAKKVQAETSLSSVKKEADKHIKKFEEENELKASSKQKDEITEVIRQRVIAKKTAELAQKTMKKMIEDLSKKPIIDVAYECLKQLSVFDGAVDK